MINDKQQQRELTLKRLERDMENFKRIQELENDEERVEEIESIENNILSVDIRKEYKILNSFGGPSDGYKVICDSNNELEEVYYFYANWGTYEEIRLNDEELQLFTYIYSSTLECTLY